MPDAPAPRLTADLATPAVLVDVPRLERNLQALQERAHGWGVSLRPHAKTHKSVAVAERQRALGARGLTVATVREAEVFAAAGWDDLRLAYTVVGEDDHRRLAALAARGVRVSFCADTRGGARLASAIWAASGQTADLLIEVDTGHGRCGVHWDDDVADFARDVAALPGLRLTGLLTHGGHAYFGPREGEAPRVALVRAMTEERDRLLALAERLHAAGALAADAELSVGSTPTLSVFEPATRGPFRITEVRPGNYVFHDAEQVALGSATLDDCALTVLATIISRHRDDDGTERVFLDAGKKVLTSDVGAATDGYGVLLYNPVRRTLLPHARIVALSEEHGWVRVPGGATFAVGDRVQLVPNHACVVVNTQERLWACDGEAVVAEWTVDARGY